MVQKRFRSGINRTKKRTFSGTQISLDHDLDLLDVKVRLKNTNKPKTIRLKYNLDRPKECFSNFHEPWPSKFNWRILNISWHLSYAISRKSYLVKAPARGAQRTNLWLPREAKGPFSQKSYHNWDVPSSDRCKICTNAFNSWSETLTNWNINQRFRRSETLTNSFNTVMTKAAEEVLDKPCRKVQHWVTEEILGTCDIRRKLKQVKKKAGADEYKNFIKQIGKDMK